ncbi:hypothetical protein A3L10_02655 [Thermococcus radiotolerans]|uniref:ABC-type uncharacterized transport system domain-containing protein n=1 Tax=Thermococcus radiotolerans TaxID=187880 RepID=A0A2Z2MVY6_9EURY|nr:hypothetical protein A3L10_02655 [Thermococcus radiotolerans]
MYLFDEFKIEPRYASDIKPYIPQIGVESLEVSGPMLEGVPRNISVRIYNHGTLDDNITVVLRDNSDEIGRDTQVIRVNQTAVYEFTYIPRFTGSLTITVIVLDGTGNITDERYYDYFVTPNPYKISYGLTPYYERLYNKEMANITPLYENLTWVIGELTSCGVNLGDLEPNVEWINATMAEIQKEYALYDTLKGLLVQQNPYRSAYYYPVMVHIRKAAMMSRDVLREIEFVLPILQRTYEQVEPICHPPAPSNETTLGNETPTNQTNVTPSTNVTIHITKVLIDASHGQYYNPTKTDTSGMSTLIDNIKSELGWIVDVNLDPITYDKLKDYDVLIITNPSQDITDEEAQAIQQFVENGGGLFILGENYYNHVYYKSLNRVVAKYEIEFNNDELMDDDVNTGRAWFPLVGIYNLDHPAMKFLTADHQMYYSGDTLKVSGGVAWLIRGYKTSYSEDKDGNVIYEKGSKPIIAAAVEVGQGRIVAYGSSKAISDAYYGNYINTNWPFVKGVLLWLAHQE